jgi:hypothetical protein
MESQLCLMYSIKFTHLSLMLTNGQGMIELIKEDADKGFEDLEVIDERDS